MAKFRFVNMAGGSYSPNGQKVSVKIKRGRLERVEEWEIPFGQELPYTPQQQDETLRFVPRGEAPELKSCKLTLDAPLREDVLLFVIEHPRREIYQLWLSDKK